MDKERLLHTLGQCSVVADDPFGERNARVLTFSPGRSRVTIRIVFADEQSGADLLITNMTTLPDEEKRQGHGSACIDTVVRAAHEHGFKNIQATQVQRVSEDFWKKNGFVSLNNTTNDFRFTKKT